MGRPVFGQGNFVGFQKKVQHDQRPHREKRCGLLFCELSDTPELWDSCHQGAGES